MFHKLLALHGAPLSKFAKFFPSFCNFILSSYYAEKFRKHLHNYFHMLFVSSQRGISKKKTQKKDIRKKSQDVLFLEKQVFQFCLISVWDLLRLIPWVLDLKFLPDIPYCAYWVVAEIWASNSFHKISNDFLFIIVTTVRNVRFCVKLFDNAL